jgi:hypothetical protein
MDVEPNPKNPTLKIPPSKAWRRLHHANATRPRAAHCIANNPRTVQRSAAQRSALHRNQLAAHRPAHRISCIVNSGIVHRTGILICPFIGAVPTSGFADFQWKSPFDTCPATMSPLSLTNLHVSIGGQNVLNSTLNMTYESFLEQVNLAEKLTSSDFGVSTGLISQGYWENSKWYFVNVERGNIADKLQPCNINVSFTNNSNVAIDVLIFTFYSDQLTIDVETGIVTK